MNDVWLVEHENLFGKKSVIEICDSLEGAVTYVQNVASKRHSLQPWCRLNDRVWGSGSEQVRIYPRKILKAETANEPYCG